MTPDERALHAVLDRARTAGFLGPGPVEPHLEHAAGFALAAEQAQDRPPASFVDLGTGGGVPGLVLACRWTGARGSFVESNRRRCAFLRTSVADLGLEARIEVLETRAEDAGRRATHRERFELVTARSFAEPAVTGELASGFLMVGGLLVVSEPPAPDGARWPTAGLQELGLGPAELTVLSGAHFAVVRKVEPTADRFPRPVGRPSKRPLW